jgi:hypothetical protein
MLGITILGPCSRENPMGLRAGATVSPGLGRDRGVRPVDPDIDGAGPACRVILAAADDDSVSGERDMPRGTATDGVSTRQGSPRARGLCFAQGQHPREVLPEARHTDPVGLGYAPDVLHHQVSRGRMIDPRDGTARRAALSVNCPTSLDQSFSDPMNHAS